MEYCFLFGITLNLIQSEALTAALEGHWEYTNRVFLTAEEKEEGEKLDDLEMKITAQRDKHISNDQQNALTLDGDTVASEESRLTKEMLLLLKRFYLFSWH